VGVQWKIGDLVQLLNLVNEEVIASSTMRRLGDWGVCTMVYRLEKVGIEFNLVGSWKVMAMSNYKCQIGMMIHHS